MEATIGYGDEILATGMARGAKARGKRIAFGDGKKIVFSPWSQTIFKNNPNIARPGDEGASDIEWIAHYKGGRMYNKMAPSRDRWVWNLDFRPVPGEMFFSDDELKFADAAGLDFILLEPNVPWHKSVASNKDWGAARYELVARRLLSQGHDVVQFVYDKAKVQIRKVRMLRAPTFRHALAALSRASLYIGPEGGLHHGAAAVGVPAVVLFGGFIPPQVTGYDTHVNLTGNAAYACGKFTKCQHCKDAMDAISVNEVLDAASRLLSKAA